MTVVLPADLERALAETARARQRPVDELVQDALRWYLHIDPALWDELDAWQEVRDEALNLVEDGRP
jgi:predicted transcriptional regulator